MNLDDLMMVWRSQDAAPLHEVNQTLLHLALRQEQAKLHAEEHRERWIIYLGSAGLVVGLAVFLALMAYTHERNGLTGWDFAAGLLGVVAAIIAGGAMYLNHARQAQREKGFGESLRDQLNRRIAQLDEAAARARVTSVVILVLMGASVPQSS